jgi:YHS domain-containing protein
VVYVFAQCSSLLGKLDYSSILKFVQGLRMILDVVCQMEVDEKTAKWKSEYHRKTYYFCAPMCKQKFDRNPRNMSSRHRSHHGWSPGVSVCPLS